MNRIICVWTVLLIVLILYAMIIMCANLIYEKDVVVVIVRDSRIDVSHDCYVGSIWLTIL